MQNFFERLEREIMHFYDRSMSILSSFIGTIVWKNAFRQIGLLPFQHTSFKSRLRNLNTRLHLDNHPRIDRLNIKNADTEFDEQIYTAEKETQI